MLLIPNTNRGSSLHIISFTRPSPTLVLEAINAGVRRPGYEASIHIQPVLNGYHKNCLYIKISTSFYKESESPKCDLGLQHISKQRNEHVCCNLLYRPLTACHDCLKDRTVKHAAHLVGGNWQRPLLNFLELHMSPVMHEPWAQQGLMPPWKFHLLLNYVQTKQDTNGKKNVERKGNYKHS